MAQKKRLETTLRDAVKTKSYRDLEGKSKEWMRATAKTASKSNTLRRNKARNTLLGDESKIATRIMSGKLYFYTYDAKNKETLPYWDKNPITLMIDTTDNGNLIGLNFHYLPPMLRAKLLDAILDIETTKSDASRLNISYNIIKAFAASDLARPCIHQYIPSHIMSHMIEIPLADYNHVVFLPLGNFDSKTGSASVSRVYSDSRKKIK